MVPWFYEEEGKIVYEKEALASQQSAPKLNVLNDKHPQISSNIILPLCHFKDLAQVHPEPSKSYMYAKKVLLGLGPSTLSEFGLLPKHFGLKYPQVIVDVPSPKRHRRHEEHEPMFCDVNLMQDQIGSCGKTPFTREIEYRIGIKLEEWQEK